MKKKFILHLAIAILWILLLILYLIQPGGWQKSKIMGVAFSSLMAVYFIIRSINDLKDKTGQD